MKGRKPLPTNVHLLHGNPGRRPLNLLEFRPAVEIPRMPPHVRASPEAAKEWVRITVELVRYGLISKVDRAALTGYVMHWAKHVEAEAMIAKASEGGKSGLFVTTPNGYPVQSPWVALSNSAMDRCLRFLVEFGMTPSARTRVAPSPQMQLPGMGAASGGFNDL